MTADSSGSTHLCLPSHSSLNPLSLAPRRVFVLPSSSFQARTLLHTSYVQGPFQEAPRRQISNTKTCQVLCRIDPELSATKGCADNATGKGYQRHPTSPLVSPASVRALSRARGRPSAPSRIVFSNLNFPNLLLTKLTKTRGNKGTTPALCGITFRSGPRLCFSSNQFWAWTVPSPQLHDPLYHDCLWIGGAGKRLRWQISSCAVCILLWALSIHLRRVPLQAS